MEVATTMGDEYATARALELRADLAELTDGSQGQDDRSLATAIHQRLGIAARG